MSKQHIVTSGLAAALLLVASAGSWASPNNLLNIPTADIMPKQTVLVQVGGEFSKSDAQFAVFSQAGVTRTIEVGLDHYLGDGGFTSANIKGQIPFIDGKVAGGVRMTSEAKLRDYFIVYSSNMEDTAPIRVHAGVAYGNSLKRAMEQHFGAPMTAAELMPFAGIEIPQGKMPLVGKPGCYMLELVGGTDLFASAGAKFMVGGFEVRTGLLAEKSDMLKDGNARVALQVGKKISL